MPRFLMVANEVREDYRCLLTFLLSIANHLTLVPRFFCAQLADKWKDIVVNEASGGSHTLDLSTWMSKAILDA